MISDFEIRFMRPRFAIPCMSQSGSRLPPTLTYTPDIRGSNFSQLVSSGITLPGLPSVVASLVIPLVMKPDV